MPTKNVKRPRSSKSKKSAGGKTKTTRRPVIGVASRRVQVSDSFSWAMAVADNTHARTLSIPQKMKAKGICACM